MPYSVFCVVKQGSQAANYIIEDPDPTTSRIFVENQSHDLATLSPKLGEFWRWQASTDIAEPYGTLSDFKLQPPLLTNNKWCWGSLAMYARQEAWGAPGHSDPWIASLDYENLPGRQHFKTSNGLVVAGYYDGYSSNNGLMSWWVGTDMDGPALYRVDNQGDLVTVFYEDPLVPGEFWGINYDNGVYYTGKMRFYPSGVTWSSQRTVSGHAFFLGVNADGSVIFVEVNGSNAQCDFYKHGTTGTPQLIYTKIPRNSETLHHQFPSNIRHYSASRKVFYQTDWDNNPIQDEKELLLTQFTWNPVSGTVNSKNCIINWPAGKKTVDYVRMIRYESTWHSGTRNAWFYKPHQFTVNGVNYLTVLWIDRYGPNSWSERIRRYQNDKRAVWVTFTIGSGENDHILTYHSHIYLGYLPRNYVRYYMPANPQGTQLILVKGEYVSTMSFDTVKGWFEHDEIPVSAKSIGIDSVNRIWIIDSSNNSYYDTNSWDYVDGQGYNRIYTYSPSTPLTIDFNLTTRDFTYAGTNVVTTATVEVRDSSGSRVEKNIRLTITGGNLTFSDGSQSRTVLTSSTQSVNVGLIISGGGRPSVTANLA